MTLKRSGFLKISIIAVVLILAAIIGLYIFLNHKITSEAPVLIDKVSSEAGFSTEIENIGLGPLFNLRIDGIKVADSKEGAKEVVAIKQIIVSPGVISSIFEQRLVINKIQVRSPKISANKDQIDRLISIIKKDEDEKSGPSTVVIENVIITNALYWATPDLEIGSSMLNTSISNLSNDDKTEIGISGDLDVSGRRIDINGSVKTGDGETAGNIELRSGDLSPSKMKLLNEKESTLETAATINIEILDLYRLSGRMTVTPEQTDNKPIRSVLKVDYDLNFDPSKNIASLDKLAIDMNGIIEGSFGGGAVIEEGDVELDIKGNVVTEDLGVLKGFIKALENDRMSGSAEANDLNVTGSLNKRDIKLTGELSVNSASFIKTDDNLQISDLDCKLNINQDLSLGSSFPMRSIGNCTAGSFNWPKTGEIENIKTKITIGSNESWSDTNIKLSDISGNYMDGGISGSLGFEIVNALGISGDLVGQSLNLNLAPKEVIPFDIEGIGESVEASFKGSSGIYDADINFTASNIVVGIGQGRVFKLSHANSFQDLKLTYTSAEDSDPDESNSQDEIIIKGSGLSYEDLSFEDYIIESGRVNDISFSLFLGGEWSLALASEGKGFEVLGKDITLSSFNEQLSIKNSGREGFSGNVRGEGGRFKSIEFPELKWNYSYRSGFINLNNLTADIGAIGRFETDDLSLSLGREGNYPIVSKFNNSKFTGLDENVSTDTLSGDFTINDPNSGDIEWDGNLEAEKLDLVSQSLEDVHIDVMPTEKGLVLKNISGSFLGGSLSGDIDVDTTGPRADVVSDLDVSGAKIKTGDLDINIAKTEFEFSGLLPYNSLPEGVGDLTFRGVKVTKNGENYSYSAGVKAKTEGETLLIEKGFILDKDSKELSFTGKMLDSLNEQRQLKLNMPGIQIPVLMNILKPFLPDSLAQAKTAGQADLELVSYNFLYPEQSWGGKLGVLRGEFTGMLSGTELKIKEVYGTVTIKDDAESPNPLSAFMPGQLKLSKSIYKKFLKSISDFKAEDGSDFLKIGSLEYGIIKIDDIDCLLEVDRQEVNLKRLSSKAFRGGLYGTGIYEFQEPGNYNISFLFDEISLEAISKSISSEKDYITGRVNGLAWITGKGSGLNMINGPFMFWATNSPKEQRRIGEALLYKLGARERLILGSSRGYDRGEISGYIKNGVITFKVLNISNSILGFKNLSIQADSRQNSISISHLISVIRELARRALTGGPTIETN